VKAGDGEMGEMGEMGDGRWERERRGGVSVNLNERCEKNILENVICRNNLSRIV
jgi:hypothetical protein